MAKQTVQFEININSKRGETTLKSLSKGFDDITIKSKQAGQAAQQLGIKLKDLQTQGATLQTSAKAFQGLGTQISGVSAASGGATASVLELGRAISDAPYGIRGVANNLSQLASNLLFTVKSAGGATNALKALGGALMGPLGILIAIQAVIAAVEYLSANMSKAKNELAEFASEGVTENVAKLTILKDVINDTTLSMREKNNVLKEAKTEFESLSGATIDTAEGLEALNTQLDGMIKRLFDTAYANAVLENVKETMSEMAALEVTGGKEGFLSMVFQAFSPIGGSIQKAKDFNKEMGNLQEKIERYRELLNKPIGEGSIMAELLFGKTKKGGMGRRQRLLKQQLLDLSKMILDSYRKAEQLSEENEIELMNIKQRYEREELARRRQSFLDRQKQRFDDFMKAAKTNKERAQARKVWRDSQIQADSEYYEALSALGIKQTAERNRKMLELERKFAEEMVNQRLKKIQADERYFQSLRAGTAAGALNRPMSAVGAEDIEGQQELARQRRAEEQKNFEDDLARKVQNLQNEGYTLMEAERMVQSDRHQFMLETNMMEIQMERDKIEAKRNINQEYISWVSGLGDVLKGIAGDNEALATAALVLEKGSAIANVIVQTQAANAQITSNMLAEQAGYRKSAGLYSAIPPVAAAYEAQAVMAGVMGKKRIAKNKIGAAISIAKIAATTLASRSAGAGGGGGGEAGGVGAPSREFDFNLVGSTRENQLAEGVAGQFGQPIQAYVVSSQITSQQQLDNTIQTQASLGD